MKANINYLYLFLISFFVIGCQSLENNAEYERIENGVAPLALPDNFDFEMNMLSNVVNGEVFHGPRASVRYCELLLKNGTAEDIRNVELMIPGILSGQNTDPNSPHYGGFRWEIEMDAVEDLNAVQFLLHSLIPIIMDHGDKLKPETVEAIKETIRLGLLNIKKMDVGLRYTNIALKDIQNSCLGGELLGDTSIANRGYEKLKRWIAFTDRSGGTYEFNSTPYTAVALEVLNKLQRSVKNTSTKLLAKQMLYRTALSAALHMHAPTKKWAGPHGRAYYSSMTGEAGSYRLDREQMNTFQKWIDKGEIPQWLEPLLTDDVLGDQVVETVGIDEGLSISTYKADTYSFGVASRSMYNQDNRYIAWQTNAFSIHYQRPGEDKAGSIYTRYLTNDHWLGYFSAGIGRGKTGLLPDEGHFQGVQDKNRAIVLYAPRNMGALDHYSSAKSVLAVPRWNFAEDKVWVNGEAVTTFPFEVPSEEVVVMETGNIFLAIRPLTLTNLGFGSGVRIDKMEDGTLVLELYNYQGPAKTFWELAWPGAFYQGQAKNGFYSEVASKEAFTSAQAFAKAVERGSFSDTSEDRSTYSGSESQKWNVSYERDGRTLGIEVDLFDWLKPIKRWNHNGEIGWPMLESNYARQNRSGEIEIDGNILKTGKSPAWLYVSPNNKIVVASYHGTEAATFFLKTKHGTVAITEMTNGTVVWENGKVTIEVSGLKGEPLVTGGQLKELIEY